MSFRDCEVTPQAVAEGREIGIAGEISKRIARMAKRAAPITHERGNRRFQEFVLQVDNGKVLGISRLAAA